MEKGVKQGFGEGILHARVRGLAVRFCGSDGSRKSGAERGCRGYRSKHRGDRMREGTHWYAALGQRAA